MYRLYTALIYLLLPAVLLYLGWRSVFEPAYRRRWGERFARTPYGPFENPIWVHAASVGEVQAVAGMVRRLRARLPDVPFLFTTQTPTGAEQVARLFGDRVAHRFLPFDVPRATDRFLSSVDPRLAIVTEMELWPNLFRSVSRRGVPLMLVNARMSEGSARAYRRMVPRLVAGTLRCATLVAAQSEEDASRLEALGVPAERLRVTGNLKFDQKVPENAREAGRALRERLGGTRPVWIAASTRSGEEEQILEAHAKVRDALPGTLLVLVPRHPDRFERVAALCRAAGHPLVRRTEERVCGPDTSVFLGDTMGEMLTYYAASDVAFVGGSLVPAGAHNVIEPAALGLPVLTGPHTFNVASVTRQLGEAGAYHQVGGAADLATAVTELLEDAAARGEMGRKARALVERNRGTADRLVTEALRMAAASAQDTEATAGRKVR